MVQVCVDCLEKGMVDVGALDTVVGYCCWILIWLTVRSGNSIPGGGGGAG